MHPDRNQAIHAFFNPEPMTIHLSINLKSHRYGMVNDPMSHRRRGQTVNFRELQSAKQPATAYPFGHRLSFDCRRHSAHPNW